MEPKRRASMNERLRRAHLWRSIRGTKENDPENELSSIDCAEPEKQKQKEKEQKDKQDKPGIVIQGWLLKATSGIQFSKWKHR